MHDLSYFRENLDVFADMAKRRNITLDLDGFRAIDKERRELITANEHRKAQRNKASEEIARLKKNKGNADVLIAEMKQVSEQIKFADEKIDQLDAKQRDLMLTIPNLLDASVPTGKGSEDNVEVRRWGSPPPFTFTPRPHWELGESAGILDLQRAVKIAGTRSGSASRARSSEFLPGRSHPGTRLHRDIATLYRQHGFADRGRQTAKICQ